MLHPGVKGNDDEVTVIQLSQLKLFKQFPACMQGGSKSSFRTYLGSSSLWLLLLVILIAVGSSNSQFLSSFVLKGVWCGVYVGMQQYFVS